MKQIYISGNFLRFNTLLIRTDLVASIVLDGDFIVLRYYGELETTRIVRLKFNTEAEALLAFDQLLLPE